MVKEPRMSGKVTKVIRHACSYLAIVVGTGATLVH